MVTVTLVPIASNLFAVAFSTGGSTVVLGVFEGSLAHSGYQLLQFK